MSKEERPRQVKILILEKLPEDNYQILKYIIQFLSKVSIRSEYLIYRVFQELILHLQEVIPKVSLNEKLYINVGMVLSSYLHLVTGNVQTLFSMVFVMRVFILMVRNIRCVS
jgi:hypothetical protein